MKTMIVFVYLFVRYIFLSIFWGVGRDLMVALVCKGIRQKSLSVRSMYERNSLLLIACQCKERRKIAGTDGKD